MCMLLPSGETRNYISAQKERSGLRDRSDSDTAAQGMKWLEVSMSLLEGVVLASNPRRLHLMRWTQS